MLRILLAMTIKVAWGLKATSRTIAAVALRRATNAKSTQKARVALEIEAVASLNVGAASVGCTPLQRTEKLVMDQQRASVLVVMYCRNHVLDEQHGKALNDRSVTILDQMNAHAHKMYLPARAELILMFNPIAAPNRSAVLV